VAERSQRQLGIVAVFGSLIPVIIVVTFIVFHFTRGGALTGSSVIEREKHIVHEYKMVTLLPQSLVSPDSTSPPPSLFV